MNAKLGIYMLLVDFSQKAMTQHDSCDDIAR